MQVRNKICIYCSLGGPLLWHFQNHSFINLPLTVTVTAGIKNTPAPPQRMNFRHIKVSVLCTAVKNFWTYGQECYTRVMWWAYTFFYFPFTPRYEIQSNRMNFHCLSNLKQSMKESSRVSEHEKDKMWAGKRETERQRDIVAKESKSDTGKSRTEQSQNSLLPSLARPISTDHVAPPHNQRHMEWITQCQSWESHTYTGWYWTTENFSTCPHVRRRNVGYRVKHLRGGLWTSALCRSIPLGRTSANVSGEISLSAKKWTWMWCCVGSSAKSRAKG